MTMPKVIEFLNLLGFRVNETTEPFILFLCVIVILTTIALVCVLNIMLYVGILYIFESKSRLDRYTQKLPPILIRIMNIYKKTRIYYIILELILLLVCLISIIWLCGRIVVGLIF